MNFFKRKWRRRKAVSVHVACYDQSLQTRWLVNNKELFFTDQEAGKAKIKADSASGKGSLLQGISSHGRRGKAGLWGLFSKGTEAVSLLLLQ